MMDTYGPPLSQKRFEPQIPQKPRLAFSDDTNQVTSPDTLRPVRATDVAVTKLPVIFRHCLQWQATTGRKGPRAV